MRPPTDPGRHIEIVFAEADRIVDVDTEDEDHAVADVLIDAIDRDADDAERVLHEGVANGTVRRRP